MNFKSKNNEELNNLLDFYKLFDDKISNIGIKILLYGSLSYIFFTKDENITIGDIDLIGYEEDFSKIIEIMKNQKDVIYELTNHNSLRLLKNGAKISIHSWKLALDITNFEEDIINIEINGVNFKSLGLNDLIKFYKKGCSYEIQRKTGYKDKLNNLLLEKYKNHTFFLLKPSTIKRNNYEEIIKFIKNNGFEIVENKKIILSLEDVDYLYSDEYRALIPIFGIENMEFALEIAHKNFDNKDVFLLLVKKENAIEKADILKGNTFWPVNCNKESIRYIFREKEYDDFIVPKGKIVEVPCDNIIHCPKTKEEFLKVILKWFT